MRERCCKSDAALNWSDLFVFDEHQMFQLKQETFKMSLDLQWGLRVLSSIVFFSLSLMESACTGECYGNFTKSSLRLINVMPAFPQLISSLSLRCFFFTEMVQEMLQGNKKNRLFLFFAWIINGRLCFWLTGWHNYQCKYNTISVLKGFFSLSL